ncbi:hypothetical protein ACFLV4_04805 [Chloroflexota bacterium]
MSKLIDKLNLASQAAPQPMGFRARQPSPTKPAMLLIATFTKANVDGLADYVAGADGGLWHISPGLEAKAFHKVSKSLPDIPWGWWLDVGSEEELGNISKLGGDFVVFPAASTPLAIPQDDEVGKILQVEASLSEGLLRTIDDLPIDAVLLTSDPFLTWHHLMLFQRAARLLAKPLLATTPSNVAANELQALWEAGVDGIVVEVEVGKPAGRLNELHQILNELSYPSSRKRGKIEPLLPHITGDTDLITEEEEE